MSENPQILLKFHAESFYIEAALLSLKPAHLYSMKPQEGSIHDYRASVYLSASP